MAANATDPAARSVHGTNPQFLVERLTRDKVYAQTYWKERCFGVSAAALVDLAAELREVGGSYGSQNRTTHFLCLLLKMLQIQPDKEIVFIKNEEFKYVRLLGAFYMRMVGRPLDVYQYLEPLYNDYRRVRLRTPAGRFALTFVDAFVAELLGSDTCLEIALPRLPHRWTLEAVGALPPRVSVLEELAAEDGALGGGGGGADGGVDVDRALAAAEAAADAAAAEAAAAGSAPGAAAAAAGGRAGAGRALAIEAAPPTERKRQRDEAAPPEDALAAENALRASLGLRPLRQ